MSIKLNLIKFQLYQQNRKTKVDIGILRRTIYLLSLSAIFINPVAANQLPTPQISPTPAETYITQTTAEDFILRGVQKLEIGNLQEAIEDFDQAITIDPNSVPAYFNRGQAYVLQGEIQKALTDFNQAIEIDPNSFIAYNNRGLAHLQRGDFEGAIADFTTVIDMNSNFAPAYNNRGVTHLQVGNIQDAIADFNRTIEITPNDVNGIQ